ncbi:MAG: NUDIX hydrolase [Candidatus Woesearchaeota archaeon]
MIRLLVTSAIIKKDNKILLVKRAKNPYKGYWSFPGGTGAFKVLHDPKDAVSAEVKGDLQCPFKGDFFTYSYNFFEHPTITMFFIGTIAGEPKIDKTYSLDYKWITPEEALKIDLAFDHVSILKKYIKQSNINI